MLASSRISFTVGVPYIRYVLSGRQRVCSVARVHVRCFAAEIFQENLKNEIQRYCHFPAESADLELE